MQGMVFAPRNANTVDDCPMRLSCSTTAMYALLAVSRSWRFGMDLLASSDGLTVFATAKVIYYRRMLSCEGRAIYAHTDS